MNEKNDGFWNTNQLRWQIRTVPVDENIGQYKAYLQQKWITDTGDFNAPYKEEWRDVPTAAEEEE